MLKYEKETKTRLLKRKYMAITKKLFCGRILVKQAMPRARAARYQMEKKSNCERAIKVMLLKSKPGASMVKPV
jgi:hypothetical protein